MNKPHLLLTSAWRAARLAFHHLRAGVRAGSLLLFLIYLLAPAAQAAPPTDWHRLLPSEVLPTDQFQLGDFDVAHGNDIFVGVGGDDGAVATSSDGVNWKPVLPGTFDYIGSVAYGGGTFVAVGTEKVHTSTDGMNWTTHAGFGLNDTLYRVRFLNGLFVAAGTERIFTGGSLWAGILYTSPDGITWTRRLRIAPPAGADVGPAGIAYGNGRFISLWGQWDGASDIGFTYTSTDGVTWTRGDPNPLLDAPHNLAFGEAGFVLLSGNRILTSADGLVWQLRHELEKSWDWQSLACSGKRIVCLAGQYSELSSTDPILALSSQDGINWRQAPLPSVGWRRLFSDGVTFFALAASSALSSTDGLAWTEHFTPTPLDLGSAGLSDVAYGAQGFVAVGDEGTIIASADGTSWEKRESGTEWWLSDVIHASGRYVAAGQGGTLLHSADGQLWSAVDLDGVTLPLGPLTHGSGRFVVVTRQSSNGFFWTSEDGISWQVRFSDALSFFNGIRSMAYGNGRFVVTGSHLDGNLSGMFVATSEDGIVWQRSPLAEPYRQSEFANLLFDGSRFLATSTGELGPAGLLSSPDGLSWTTLDASGSFWPSGAIGHGGGHLIAIRWPGEDAWADSTGGIITLLETSVDGSSWTTAAPFHFGESPLKFAYGSGRFVGVGSGWHDKPAQLLISGYTPPMALPQLNLRREAAKLMLTIRGRSGSHWTLQRSSTLLDWQTVGPITLGTAPLEIDVTPEAETHGFWRLAEPSK
jgi:hypothetical protein